MLTKILAGALAALAVGGVGVYFTWFSGGTDLPGTCCTRQASPIPVSEGRSCCTQAIPTCCMDANESCALGEAARMEPLAACAGGVTAVVPSGRSQAVRCCDE